MSNKREDKQFFFKADYNESPKRDISKVLEKFKGRTGHIWLGIEIFTRERGMGESTKK